MHTELQNYLAFARACALVPQPHTLTTTCTTHTHTHTLSRSLTTLVVTENRFGDKGAQSLMGSLHSNNSLAVLTVDPSLSQGIQGNMMRAMLEKNKELLKYKKMVKELQVETERLKGERDYYQDQLKSN